MRVLHGISSVSVQSTRYLVDALRKIGIECDIVIYRGNKLLIGFEDINLNLDFSKRLLFPLYAFRILFFFCKAIFKYNIFHFHFGHSLLPRNLDLPILKALGKKVFMEYHGSDIRRKSLCSHSDLFDYCVDDTISFERQRRISKNVRAIIVHDNELKGNLFDFGIPVHIVPLRLDVEKFSFEYCKNEKGPIVIVHSPSKQKVKGTEFIISAIDNLKSIYNIEFILLHDLPNSIIKETFKRADIVIDQLLIGEYGMVSIEAMAMAKPVICHLKEDFFDDKCPRPPIFNASVFDIKSRIEELILNYNLRIELGRKGRLFVEQYHNSNIVAGNVKDIYLMR